MTASALAAQAKPVLSAFCATVQHFGPVGAGGRAKLLNNAMVIGIAALVLEAFTKARQTNTDMGQLYDVVTTPMCNDPLPSRALST